MAKGDWRCPDCGTANGWTSLWCGLCGKFTYPNLYEKQSFDPPRERLQCPNCGAQHVDEGEWATRAHHRHLCGVCGIEWEQGYLSFGAVLKT